MYLIIYQEVWLFILLLGCFPNNKPDITKDLTIFMISSIFSSEVMNAVVFDSKMFFWIAASVYDASVINLDSIKMVLANDVSRFFINGKPAAINGLRKLSGAPF